MIRTKLPRGLTLRGNSIIATFALSDGTMARRSVGTAGVSGVNDCVRKRLEFIRAVELGTYKPPEARVKVTVYTVGDLWPVYLVDYKNRSNKDSSRLEISWNHLKGKFEKMWVADVTTAAINEYIASRRDAGMGNGTVNREIALLRAMLHLGTRQTPVMVDRMPSFPKRLVEPPARKGFVGDKEYALMAANAKELSLKALIACAYSFGFRKGELLNLHVRQVDLMDRLIELEEGTTKNNEARKVYMTTEAFELMRECVRGKKPDDHVFTRQDGSRVVDPRQEWYSLCVSCGFGKFENKTRKDGSKFVSYSGLNLHDFRRSAVRNMTRRGVSQTVAMKISGHKTVSVFKRYDIVDIADLEEATRKIEAGRQLDFLRSKTGTKSDTSGSQESQGSSNSLN